MTAPTPQPGANPGVPDAPGLSTAPGVIRRALLRASPALLAPALLAGPALANTDAAPADTPILRLYREWVALEADLQARPSISDEDLDAGMEVLRGIEEQMAAEPITGLADLAAKLLTLS